MSLSRHQKLVLELGLSSLQDNMESISIFNKLSRVRYFGIAMHRDETGSEKRRLVKEALYVVLLLPLSMGHTTCGWRGWVLQENTDRVLVSRRLLAHLLFT